MTKPILLRLTASNAMLNAVGFGNPIGEITACAVRLPRWDRHRPQDIMRSKQYGNLTTANAGVGHHLLSNNVFDFDTRLAFLVCKLAVVYVATDAADITMDIGMNSVYFHSVLVVVYFAYLFG